MSIIFFKTIPFRYLPIYITRYFIFLKCLIHLYNLEYKYLALKIGTFFSGKHYPRDAFQRRMQGARFLVTSHGRKYLIVNKAKRDTSFKPYHKCSNYLDWVSRLGTDRNKEAPNQNSLFISRDWFSANQGPVFPDSVGFR